jgi:hypothetical protein
VPLLNGAHRRVIAHEYGVDPFTEEPLGHVRVGCAGAQEIAERAQDPAIKPVPDGQERGGTRGQSDPVALQLAERFVPGGELSD